MNLGSAVILPEVFLKALTLVRNLGFTVKKFTTVDMDFIRHYRPMANVVKRPTLEGGEGFSLTGHNEIMFPMLAAALIESLENKFENHLSHHQLYLKILVAPVIVGIILIITAQVLTLMRLNIPIK